jgi:hypothetical protein
MQQLSRLPVRHSHPARGAQARKKIPMECRGTSRQQPRPEDDAFAGIHDIGSAVSPNGIEFSPLLYLFFLARGNRLWFPKYATDITINKLDCFTQRNYCPMQPPLSVFSPDRYSAKRMFKPVNFICFSPLAKSVYLAGDFNAWNQESHPMQRQPDGAWLLQLPLHHGHHRYRFIVDGQPVLDPRASGVGRDDHGERVSLVAVS